MARPRSQIVNPTATPYYHCVSRCVRRAWLCGEDALTGRSFDHRKPWLQSRLHELSQVFAIDICAYALMSNHYHLVVRIDSERAASWDDDEVMRRYARLHPYATRQLTTCDATQRPVLLRTWRQRLGSLSWMMSALNEWIARKANKEDERTGRFWEGRFYSQPLLGVSGLINAMAYVDLNPIRAGLADTLEESDFTSIQKRMIAAAMAKRGGRNRQRPQPQLADGLVPFQDKGEADGVLPISLSDYVAILQWIARRGTDEVPTSSRNLPFACDHWCNTHFSSSFEKRGALGPSEELERYATATCRKWVRGIGAARRDEKWAA